MKRGDLVAVAIQGDYGKSRAALVIQADAFAHTASVAVLPLTSALQDLPLLRVDLAPNPENSLAQPSQVMIDKPATLKRDKIGPVWGQLDPETLLEIERRLLVFLGIA